MHSVCQIAFMPVRKEPTHRSEMTTQLLFGDDFEIISEEKDWYFIKNGFDHYEGWIASNEVKLFDDADYFSYMNKKTLLQKSPLSGINIRNESYFSGFGSRISELKNNEYLCGRLRLSTKSSDWLYEGSATAEEIIDIGLRLKGIPYLWGGRSIWGIDCSGLTQNLFRMAGIHLKRDAWQQETQGTEISFSERKPCDLAFFCNDNGHVVHVGIILNEHEILHASGKVRIDELHSQGIFKTETQKYTHQLKSVKRFF